MRVTVLTGIFFSLVLSIAVSVIIANTTDELSFYNSCANTISRVIYALFLYIFIINFVLVILITCFNWRTAERLVVAGVPLGRRRDLIEERPSESTDDRESIPIPVPASMRCLGQCRITVHWNTVWIVLYLGLYFNALTATWYGFKVYALQDTKAPSVVQTCKSGPNFLHEFGHKLSWDVLFIVYWTLVTLFVVQRKTRDPNDFAAYFSCRRIKQFFTCSIRGGINPIAMFLEFTIVVFSSVALAFCWLSGKTTPKLWFNGLSFTLSMIWLIVMMLHILQASRPQGPMLPPEGQEPLAYHWVWVLIVLTIMEGLSISFYISVYRISDPLYLVFHGVCWLIFIIVTVCKFERIFNLPEKRKEKGHEILTNQPEKSSECIDPNSELTVSNTL